LQSRIGAFGVKTGMITSDEEMVAVACEMFGIEASTIDEAWTASLALGKKERGRRARASRLRHPFARYFGLIDWSKPYVEELDAEREERIMIAKARSTVMHMIPRDPRRLQVEAFLKRKRWSEAGV
jgi:hypothetical protein